MKKANTFDVLIVYSQGYAVSASSKKATTPFPPGEIAHYNNAYSYLMDMCQANNLTVALTTSQDITGAGECRSYWLWEKSLWKKVVHTASSTLIFDKLSPTTPARAAKRNLLFSSPKIRAYSNAHLFSLFFDKQKTHDNLPAFSLPTISLLSSGRESINQAINVLQSVSNSHTAKNDFTSSLILKDRFGSGGNEIYIIESNHAQKIQKIMTSNPTISFILQPYVSFSDGYSYKNFKRATDIRIIFEGQRIVQTYIRMAHPQDFRCNEQQGGTLIYTFQKDIPIEVLRAAKKISKILKRKYSLYALDFIVTDNGTIFLLEGNNSPGLDWNLSLAKNERKAKQLIRVIAKELQTRAELQKTSLIENTNVLEGKSPATFLEN